MSRYRRNRRWVAAVLLAVLLAGCGESFEVGIEPAPTGRSGFGAPLASTPPAFPAVLTATPQPGGRPPTTRGQIAYLQGGDVWVKVLPAGQPQRLTTDGRNRSPRWSPSGEWLAFARDDALWVMRADGTAAQRTPAAAIRALWAWSPVADRLAYAAQSELYVIEPEEMANVAGRNASPLYRPTGAEAASGQVAPAIDSLAWSPDGSMIAFVQQRGQPGSPPDSIAIWTVESRQGGTAVRRYGPPGPPEDGILLAGWSPDGQAILFWPQPAWANSVTADGLPLMRVPVKGGGIEKTGYVTLIDFDFLGITPGVARMALTVGAGRMTWRDKAVVLADLSSHTAVTVTSPAVAALSARLSPDGRQVAYAAGPDAGDVDAGATARALQERHLWVSRADGSGSRQLTGDAAYRDEWPAWSSDSAWLLFGRISTTGQASVWLIPAGGGSPRALVNELTPAPPASGYYGYTAWDNLFDWWQPPSPQPATVVPTAPPPVETIVPAAGNQERYTFPELGLSFEAPAGWETIRHPGAAFAGPPPVSLSAYALMAGVQLDVPHDLPGLTRALSGRLAEQNHGFRVTTIPVGDRDAAAFWGVGQSCLDVYVPGEGIVLHVSLQAPLCDGQPGQEHLTAQGKDLLDSVKFSPATGQFGAPGPAAGPTP